MEFIVKKDHFLSLIQITQKAISSKSVVPSMSGILFDVNKVINMRATDLELLVDSSIEAQIKKTGKVILPAKLLIDIVKNLDGDSVFISTQDSVACISSGNAEFKVNTVYADDFPENTISDLDDIGSIQGMVIKRGITHVIKAAAKDESRPILTGIFLRVVENTIEFAATDSYRLAVYKDSLDKNLDKNIELIIPNRILDEILKIADDSMKLNISCSGSHVKFNIGTIQVISRLIDGQYPPYSQLIPDKFKYSIKINSNELMNSVRRIMSVAVNNPIKITFDKNFLTISVVNQGIGEAVDKIKIKFSGETFVTAFNSNYLLDGIQACNCDEVIINLNEQNKPVLLKPDKQEGFDFSYIIMPVRVNE